MDELDFSFEEGEIYKFVGIRTTYLARGNSVTTSSVECTNWLDVTKNEWSVSSSRMAIRTVVPITAEEEALYLEYERSKNNFKEGELVKVVIDNAYIPVGETVTVCCTGHDQDYQCRTSDMVLYWLKTAWLETAESKVIAPLNPTKDKATTQKKKKVSIIQSLVEPDDW